MKPHDVQTYQIFQLFHQLHFDKTRSLYFHLSNRLGFPASDIHALHQTKTKNIIDLNGFGWKNILPSNLERLFNHWLYQLLYILFLKYHPIFLPSVRESKNYTSLQHILNAGIEWIEPFNHLNILYFKTKNLRNLHQVIRQVLNIYGFVCNEIICESFIPIWKPLAHCPSLHHETRLSTNIILGKRILNTSMTIDLYLHIPSLEHQKRKWFFIRSEITHCIQQFLSIELSIRLFCLVPQPSRLPIKLDQKFILLNRLIPTEREVTI